MIVTIILAVASIFFIMILLTDQLFDYTLWGSYVEQNYVNVQEVKSVNDFYYEGYFLENNELQVIQFDGNFIPLKNIKIEEGYYDNNSINYQVKNNRYGRPVYDEDNYATITLKPNYEIIKDPKTFISANDLKTRFVIKNECVDDIKFENGVFTFYSLKNQLNYFVFKDSPEHKLNFIIGDTKGKMACVNFNYQETFNHDIVNNNQKPLHDVIISKDFNLKSSILQ